jgi:hypothetical protein
VNSISLVLNQSEAKLKIDEDTINISSCIFLENDTTKVIKKYKTFGENKIIWSILDTKYEIYCQKSKLNLK